MKVHGVSRGGVLRPGRTRLVLVIAAALMAVAGVGAWFALRSGDEAQAASLTREVTRETLTRTVSVSGTLAAASAADLDFEVSGTVSKVLVSEGDTVHKGQALARIDDTSLVAARTAAVSALSAVEAQYAELVADDAESIQVAAAQSTVVSAKDTVARAREEVRQTTLRSTLKGTVTSLSLQVGDVVGGSGSGTGGADATGSSDSSSTAAVRVVGKGRFVLAATVAAASVDQLTKGQQATLTISGVDDTVYATVSEVGLVAQTGSGGAAVFPVTLSVTGTRDDLYPGTSADASITVEKRADVLAVPTQALSSSDGRTTVTVRADGKDSTVEVTTGETFGTSTEIIDGLAEGDVVVLAGFTRPGGGQGGSGGDGGGRMQLPDGITPPSGGFPGGGIPGGGQ